MTLPRIDRAAALRRDADRLMRALDSPGTLLVPVWRDKIVIAPGLEPRAIFPAVADAGSLVDAAGGVVWLGRGRPQKCFPLGVAGVEGAAPPAPPPCGGGA